MRYIEAYSISCCLLRGLDVGGARRDVRTKGSESLEACVKADAVILRQGEDRRGYGYGPRHLSPKTKVRGTYTTDTRQGIGREDVVAPAIK